MQRLAFNHVICAAVLACGWLLALSILSVTPAAAEPEILGVKTASGWLVVGDDSRAHFTVEIDGGNARLANGPGAFMADGRFIQVAVADPASFPTSALDPMSILKAHMDWEVAYRNGVMPGVTAEIIPSDAKGARLRWQITRPASYPGKKAEVTHDLYITHVVADRVVVLCTSVEAPESAESGWSRLNTIDASFSASGVHNDITALALKIRNGDR